MLKGTADLAPNNGSAIYELDSSLRHFISEKRLKIAALQSCAEGYNLKHLAQNQHSFNVRLLPQSRNSGIVAGCCNKDRLLSKIISVSTTTNK